MKWNVFCNTAVSNLVTVTSPLFCGLHPLCVWCELDCVTPPQLWIIFPLISHFLRSFCKTDFPSWIVGCRRWRWYQANMSWFTSCWWLARKSHTYKHSHIRKPSDMWIWDCVRSRLGPQTIFKVQWLWQRAISTLIWPIKFNSTKLSGSNVGGWLVSVVGIASPASLSSTLSSTLSSSSSSWLSVARIAWYKFLGPKSSNSGDSGKSPKLAPLEVTWVILTIVEVLWWESSPGNTYCGGSTTLEK